MMLWSGPNYVFTKNSCLYTSGRGGRKPSFGCCWQEIQFRSHENKSSLRGETRHAVWEVAWEYTLAGKILFRSQSWSLPPPTAEKQSSQWGVNVSPRWLSGLQDENCVFACSQLRAPGAIQIPGELPEVLLKTVCSTRKPMFWLCSIHFSFYSVQCIKIY